MSRTALYKQKVTKYTDVMCLREGALKHQCFTHACLKYTLIEICSFEGKTILSNNFARIAHNFIT